MKTIDLSEWIQRFFQEYLSRQRNVSAATIAAYRDTFRLLLQYFGRKRRCAPVFLSMENLTAPVVLGFLNHLKARLANTVRTRNLRLATLRSFALPDRLARARTASADPTHSGHSLQAPS
jgi:site-specific recombinase XerD